MNEHSNTNGRGAQRNGAPPRRTNRPAGARRSTWTSSTATTRCSPQARTRAGATELGGPAQLEGGDILVIGNRCVLIGMGERTRPAAVERLATGLFGARAADRVIALPLPEQRSSMHLDTVLTMLDRDAFTLYPGIRDQLRAFLLTPGLRGLSVEEEPDAIQAMADALELPRLRIFETGGDRRHRGHHDRRLRARARTRRSALHVLPDPTRPALARRPP